jgi:ubiquitin carboxyl-terminal hydrolase 8
MNSRGPSKGEVTEEVARAIIEMNKGHRSIGLHDLKTAFGKFNKTFRSSEQQDSHEFLTFLLDHMHEELNKGKKQPFKEQKNDGIADITAANIAWADYVRANDSIIVELFCGQQKSSVKCMACNKSSTTFDTFFVLSIPIPDSRIPGKRYSLHECLDLYTAEEEINDWGCANCKTNGKAKKKIDLWRLPPTLIIHFQRFYVDSYCKKRITDIDFPVDCLDLTGLVKDRHQISPSATWKYQLYGTSNHYGTMDSGHYTAYCRKKQSWAKFDDQEVNAMMSANVPSAAAYILFYSQIQ